MLIVLWIYTVLLSCMCLTCIIAVCTARYAVSRSLTMRTLRVCNAIMSWLSWAVLILGVFWVGDFILHRLFAHAL